MNSFRPLLVQLAFCLPFFAHAKEVGYDLTIAKQQVDFAGKPLTAMTVNGGIPGPVLRFTEGDTAVIRVPNLQRPCLGPGQRCLRTPRHRSGW